MPTKDERIQVLRMVQQWHRKAPIDELEVVERAIGENFPQAPVDEILAREDQ
jgi:hypothetical protein